MSRLRIKKTQILFQEYFFVFCILINLYYLLSSIIINVLSLNNNQFKTIFWSKFKSKYSICFNIIKSFKVSIFYLETKFWFLLAELFLFGSFTSIYCCCCCLLAILAEKSSSRKIYLFIRTWPEGKIFILDFILDSMKLKKIEFYLTSFWSKLVPNFGFVTNCVLLVACCFKLIWKIESKNCSIIYSIKYCLFVQIDIWPRIEVYY